MKSPDNVSQMLYSSHWKHIITASLSLTERTSIVILFCLGSRIGLWEIYYYALFDITHYFPSDVGFTNIVVWSAGQSDAETKYGVPTV